MTRLKPLAALLTSAALLLTPTLGVTPAHADETKPKPGGTITPLPGDLGQSAKPATTWGARTGRRSAPAPTPTASPSTPRTTPARPLPSARTCSPSST